MGTEGDKLRLVSVNDLQSMYRQNNLRMHGTNVPTDQSIHLFGGWLDEVQLIIQSVRRDFLLHHKNLLFHQQSSTERNKFNKRSTEAQHLSPGDVVLSSQDFMKTGSVGLSLMLVESVNQSGSQAILRKARPQTGDFPNQRRLTPSLERWRV